VWRIAEAERVPRGGDAGILGSWGLAAHGRRMDKLVYRAWAKAIVFLIVAMAMFVLAHGYPLAKWGGAIFLALSVLHVLEAWGHKR
jgi:hypothetical protein